MPSTGQTLESRSRATGEVKEPTMDNKEARVEGIRKLEGALEARIIAYMMADRPPFAAQVGGDVIRLFQRHLQKIGRVSRIGLVLYTRGGDVLTPLRLVRLIREHCEKFDVVIPYRAHSAGTLIALGADRILMGEMGELAPIDPRVASPFNPEDESVRGPEAGKKPRVQISVEDMRAYLALAREGGDLSTPEGRCEAFMELARKVHPLALGSVHRSHMLIRLIAKLLLSMHMHDSQDNEKQAIQHIVETLTEKLYAHDFLISRTDAEQYVGLKVEKPSQEVESDLWALFELYEVALELEKQGGAAEMLGSEQDKAFDVASALIDSAEMTHVYVVKGRLQRAAKGAETGINVRIDSQGWRVVGDQQVG